MESVQDEAGEGLEPRVYAWEVADQDDEVAQLKRELEEQERLLEEHQKTVSGSEAQLETMIKDLRAELVGCREQSWRLEQVEELSDMKARLMLGNVVASAGAAESGMPRQIGGALDADALQELDALNAEMDIEMNALMSQLGLVKGEMEALDAQRRKLLEDMEKFEDEEEEGSGDDGGGVGAAKGGEAVLLAQGEIEP